MVRLDCSPAQIPPHAKPVGDQAHEQPFRADILEEHHQLELEEGHWINVRASQAGNSRAGTLRRAHAVKLTALHPVGAFPTHTLAFPVLERLLDGI